MRNAVTVQCADNGDSFSVDIIWDDGEVEADSYFEGKGRKAKAERRAEVLAKLCSCDWETNY